MNELISVIVPIYRVEKYLDRCIQSIINQTYRNLEIILIDDGSDDACGTICDKYARQDKRIKVIHKANEGLDRARKSGMEIATGKYIGYVDSDDWIEENMFQVMHDLAEKNKVAVVECGIIDSWEEKEEKRYPYLKEGCYKGDDFISCVEPILVYNGNFFEYGVTPNLINKLFLRDVVEKFQMIQGDLNECLNDNLVTHPAVAEGKSIYVSHQCLVHYRVNLNGLKRSQRKNIEMMYMQFYNEFRNRLQGMSKNADVERQIMYYCLYYGLYKIPYIFDDAKKDEILFPYGGIKKGARIVLYGAGAVGIHMRAYLDSIEGINIVCWVDKNYKSLEEKLDVVGLEDIHNYEYDYIVISVLRQGTVQSIMNDLLERGIPMQKVRWIEERFIEHPEELLNKATYNGIKLFEFE